MRSRILVPALLAAVAAASLGGPSTGAAAMTAGNGVYVVTACDNGTLSAVTGPSHDSGAGFEVTYPCNSYLSVQNYTSSTFSGLTTAGTHQALGSNGVRTSWTLADSLVVERDLTVTGTDTSDSVVRIALRIKNEGAGTVQVGGRLSTDFMLAGDDGPLFSARNPDDTPLQTATRWDPVPFESFALTNNTGSPTLNVRGAVNGPSGLLVTPPDALVASQCCSGAGAPLDIATPTGTFPDMDADNEVSWIWGDDITTARTVAAGAQVEFRTALYLTGSTLDPPLNAVPPAITGTPTLGGTLSTGTGTGTWSGTAFISYTHQWQRCDAAGSGCTDIAGATAGTYTLAAADAGHTLRVRVVADNDAVGTVSAESSPTAVVTSGAAPETPTTSPSPTSPSPATVVELLAPVERQTLAGGGQRVVTRLALKEPGRYTFIYLKPSGTRTPMLSGTRVGSSRVLSKRFTAPVLVSKRQGRKIVLIARLLKTAPRNATLRIVLRRADGSLVEEAVS